MDEKLSKFEKLLSIKFEPHMQDWDLELADASCVEEFCDIYERESWTQDEKRDVMRLIVASFDERLLQEEKHPVELWERIYQLLRSDCNLHKEVIEYWSLLDEEDEQNVFPVIPLMRLVWQSCNGYYFQ